MVDIGNIIKDYCRREQQSLPALAKRLNISHSTLYNSLNSNSISLQRLLQISQALNHNFFIYFIENTGGSEEQLLKLSTENKELTSKVAFLQKEVDLLREINSILKAKYTT
jgi:transcriptional regulator with XRE-family HTH domain